MKKYTILFILFYIVSLGVKAQDNALGSNASSSNGVKQLSEGDTGNGQNQSREDSVTIKPSYYAWKIAPRLGTRIFLPADTAVVDFHRSNLLEGFDITGTYLSNIGSPYQTNIYFDRPQSSRFIYLDNIKPWIESPKDHLYFNSKLPYSDVLYETAGGGISAEKRLKAELCSNFGKRINIGFNLDYIYARGFYTSSANKGLSYSVFGSYIGDRYKLHVFASNDNFSYAENGGIKDFRYITQPKSDAMQNQKFSGNSLDIPVRYANTWNKLRGRHIYINNRYDIGPLTKNTQATDTIRTLSKSKKDSIICVKHNGEEYIPLATAIWTMHYTDHRRRINSTDGGIDTLYTPYYNNQTQSKPKYDSPLDDYMSYFSIKNTFALAMNEGFRKWTKFGLTGFIEHNLRKYRLPSQLQGLFRTESESDLFIGGILSKSMGKHLRYRALVSKNLLRSDLNLEGEVQTVATIKGKDLSIKANAYIKNRPPSFFENHFASKYWSWDKDFADVRRMYIGGEVIFPSFSFSRTKVSGGIENIQNSIYYGSNGMAQQTSKNVQVLAFRIDEQLKAGVFHWDNSVAFQSTSDDEIIPLPSLNIYSNLYIKTRIAKVLTLQLGVDVHYFSKYYLQGYEPLTMQFYNQRDMKIGEFPLTTAYVNLHLKYTRFFVMMYNLTNGMGNAESFGAYRYPINPRLLKIGLSWQFHN